ncbi:MAG TPA: type II toxin-antitoxin system VapC family toxin [Stellaceae bacterium]
MIVIDTSAIVAILKVEHERDVFARIIAFEGCLFSTVGYLEASMVIVGRGRAQLTDLLDGLLSELAIELVPFDQQQARASQTAFLRFGKGRHPAGLNFGDCVSYALARSRGLPLLFKGTDFAKTDVISALG